MRLGYNFATAFAASVRNSSRFEHTTKEGVPRLRRRCGYPLTAPRCVKRIYTNLAVLDVAREGLVVLEMVEGMALDRLQALTEPPLTFDDDWRPLACPAV